MKLGVTCIVKNEAPYIEEWLWFHHIQGVEKFFVYLNDCTDNTRDILERLSSYLNITIHDWSGEKQQLPAYNHSIKKHKREVDWMAFIDIDEFLHSPENDLNLSAMVSFFSVEHPTAGVIMARWVLFGSNGHEKCEPGLVIERFTRRADGADKHCKSIVRMQAVVSTGWESHTFKLKDEFKVIDEYEQVYEGPYAVTEPKTPYLFRINHYHTKSAEEYKAKCAKGRSDIGTGRVFEVEFAPHDRNEVEDTHLRDTYGERIKELMK